MDPITTSAVMGAGSGVLGFAGQMMTNAKNVQMAREANQMNMDLAAQNREWQERMANTAHQREVADLKAAGLNPILSATGGSGAASPSGNVASVSAPQIENAIGQGLSSAKDVSLLPLQLKSADKDLAVKDAQIAASTAQTAQSVATARKLDAETLWQNLDNIHKSYETGARKTRFQLEETTNKLDQKAATYDAIMNRAATASGVVGNLFSGFGKAVRGFFKGEDTSTLQRENKTMKDYIKNNYPRR